MRLKFLFSLIFCILLMPIINSHVLAASTSKFPFSARVLYSNSHQTNQGYFELNTKPNIVEPLSFLVTNLTNVPIKVNIYPAYSFSNSNTRISYYPISDTSHLNKESYVLAENMSIQNSVSLNPNEEKIVNFKVKTPPNEAGTFLGGIILTQPSTNTNINPNNKLSTFYFKNQFEFLLGLQLNMPNKESNDFMLGDKVRLQFQNLQPTIYLPLKNGFRTIIENRKLQYKVYYENDNKPLFQGSFENFKLAPHTKVEYPIYWDGSIRNGNYSMKVFDMDKNKLLKTYNFKINHKDLKIVAKNTDPKFVVNETPTWVYITMIIGAGIIIILVIALIVIRKKSVPKK